MSDKRSRFRKRKDDALLSAYAKQEYKRAMIKKALELGVPLLSIKRKGGHWKAKAKGLTTLRVWFNGLSAPSMAMARDKMREELADVEA